MSAVFRRNGYQTALVGKSHMIREWDEEGFEYIRYCDLIDGDVNDPLQNHYFKHLHDNDIAHLYDLGTLKPDHPGSKMRAFDSEIPDRHSVETWTGNTAIEFLQSRDDTRPFFMHLSFQRPHEPLTVPYDRGLLYDPEEIELPESAKDFFENKFASKPEKMKQHAKTIGGYPYIPENEKDLKRQVAYYFSLITLIDEQIGRVVEKLKETGEYENTIIVFTADHGDFAGEHGLILKNIGIYESIHRIPFIIKYPNGPKNQVKHEMIESVDLYPTLCELSNIAVPSCVEGKSAVSIIEKGERGKDQVVCEWDFPFYEKRVNAIRTHDFRLVYYGNEEGGELYDLQKDPDELYNLYDQPEYVEIQLRLMQRIMDHINQYNVKATFTQDKQVMKESRNCMTRLLHFGHKNWGDVQSLYRE